MWRRKCRQGWAKGGKICFDTVKGCRRQGIQAVKCGDGYTAEPGEVVNVVKDWWQGIFDREGGWDEELFEGNYKQFVPRTDI